MLRTHDGGATWALQPSGMMRDLHAISFQGPRIGTVVGQSGTMLRTTDAGATWTLAHSDPTTGLWAVSFADANDGTAVGDPEFYLRTTDGGITWTRQSIVAGSLGVSFVDA